MWEWREKGALTCLEGKMFVLRVRSQGWCGRRLAIIAYFWGWHFWSPSPCKWPFFSRSFQSCFGLLAGPNLFNHCIILVGHLSIVFDCKSHMKHSSYPPSLPGSLLSPITSHISHLFLLEASLNLHTSFQSGLDIPIPPRTFLIRVLTPSSSLVHELH